MPPGTHAFSEIMLSDQPAQVSIVIRHEARELIRQTLSPTYQRSQPNGPDCLPICQSAHTTLRIF
jgi:hypothetical protein